MASQPDNDTLNLKFLFWLIAVILFMPILRLFQISFTMVFSGLLMLILWRGFTEGIYKIAYVLGFLSAIPFAFYFFIWLRRQLKAWGTDI